MRKSERERVKHIKVDQKVAKTYRRVVKTASTLTVTGAERGRILVSGMTRKQLQHVLARPAKFERMFPADDLVRLAKDEIVDRNLQLEKE